MPGGKNWEKQSRRKEKSVGMKGRKAGICTYADHLM